MRYLLRYIKPYRKEAVIAPLFKFFETCMEIFVPLIMSQIIDVGIKNHDRNYILMMGGLLVLIALLGWGVAITAQYFAAKAAMGFGAEVRKALFAHILKMDQKTVDRIGIPSLITRVTNDVNRAQSGVNLVLRLALRAPFIVLGAIIMSGVISRRIMLIYIAVAIAVMLVMFLVIHFTMPFYKKIQLLVDKIALFCRENLIGIRSVRAFRMQNKESEAFSEKTDELYKTQYRAGKISALLNPASTIIINIAVILVLWLGGRLVNDGVLLNGKIIALVNYLTQILIAITAFADLAVSVNKAAASCSRIEAVMREKESVTAVYGSEAAESGAGEDSFIEFKNVTFSYDRAAKPSLREISFSVKKGDHIGIIGGTGSGKSTLIKLLQGIYPVSGGQVTVEGRDILSYSEQDRRALFAVCPQQARLFKGTIRENMKWGNENASEEEIVSALGNAAAWEFVQEKEETLDFEVESGGRNLSGGQKQRLTIARAFLKDSPVLILDDSTSALDFLTESKIRHYLSGEEREGQTAFIVSQRTHSVSSCDLILVLDEGELCGLGTHQTLLETCNVYREIYMSQQGNIAEVN